MPVRLRFTFLVIALAAASHGTAAAATITFNSEAAFNAAVAATVIDDFESFVPKDVALPGLTSNGITYTPFAGAPTPNVVVASPGYDNFGAGVGTTTTSILTTSGDEDILGVPVSAPFAIGFDVYLNGLGPATASFYNGVNLLGSVVFSATADDVQFAGILSDVPVTSFRWTSTQGGSLNTGLDNIAVGAQAVPAVPEPATVLLVGSGLIAAARRRRGRK